MWAQLQRLRIKPGTDEALLAVVDKLAEIEPEDSGRIRSTVMRSQSDPSLAFFLVVFESEEKARARENDPARQAGLVEVRALLGDVLDGPPEFFDLEVLREG